MGKSLRSKRMQKFKRIKREAKRPIEHERLIRVASKLGTTDEVVIDPPPRFSFNAIVGSLKKPDEKSLDIGEQVYLADQRRKALKEKEREEKAAKEDSTTEAKEDNDMEVDTQQQQHKKPMRRKRSTKTRKLLFFTK